MSVNTVTADRALRIGEILTMAVGLSRQVAAPRSTPFGEKVLTRTQLDILFVLAHASGDVTPGNLVDTLRVTPGAITQSVEYLRTAGLVEQSTTAHDGRVRVLRLTGTARDEVDAFEMAAVGRAVPWFTGLSDDELTQIVALLSRVQGPS